jgi:outer membrane protein assembly factor BamA
MGQIERKVFNNLYVGMNAIIIQSETTFNFPDFFPDSLKYDKRNMNNMGFQLNYDTRDHQVNPYHGFDIKLKGNFFREWMKSDNDFNRFRFTYNQYFTLANEKNILATRLNAVFSTGNVPFQGQNVVGQDDIRGYSSGRYRNDQVYAAQAEYRWRFHDKLGMVGFIGVASAVKHFEDIFKSELLPGAGVGFRYLMIPKERINIGVDFAKGKGDWGLYFRIGEAFGR